MRIVRAVCTLAFVAICFPPSASAAEITKEPLSKIKEKIDEEKGVLVDVREKREWDAGHVDQAIFLPLSRIQNGLTPKQLDSLPKDKVLYLHCAVGKRAVTAGNILEQYGYKVRPIRPGYRELISAGFPPAKE